MTAVYVVLAIGVVTILFLLQAGGGLASLISAGLVIGALTYLAMKTLASQHQKEDMAKLRATYEQLDQQTKLIIRTDLELHHAQEELDRRLASLMSLQQLGRKLQVSLHPEEVFEQLNAGVVTNFGFSVGLLGLCPQFDQLQWRSLVGVSTEKAAQIQQHLVSSGLLKTLLTNPVPQPLQSGGSLTAAQKTLLELLESASAILAGIIPHAGPAGCLLLCRPGIAAQTSKADEELVKILVNQLSAALENSAMYESAWDAQQVLERKVQERTRELAEANSELTRLNKAKSDFVSAVSHELRTPLAAIKGYASLLNSGQFGPLVAAQAERLAKIEKHSDLLTQFINNLLDIARIESGRVTMEHRVIALGEFFSTLQELVQPQVQAKQLHLSIDRNGVAELTGDAQHLQRVFVNLLSNAIKYTPANGAIQVKLRREDSSIVATVSDTGCGVPAEDLPKLFQEFYRSGDPINQQIRGTGLGLALVKRIIEAHRGTITVASEKGAGTTFTITLACQTKVQA